MKEAEHRAHQLEQDLAVALSDSRTAMEELSRLRSELKSAHSELPSAPSPDSERKPGPLVTVEASDNGTALGTQTPPSESLRALEVRLVEERDASARLKLDLNAAEIKIAENEAALAVLRASHDVQVQTIKELTSRVEASRPSSDANDTSSTDDKHAELIAMVEDKDKQIAAALARSEVAEKKSLEAEREVASLTLSLQVERDGVKVLLEDAKRASQQADTELKTATERFASELKATTDRAAAELKATQERFEKELEEARKVVSDLPHWSNASSAASKQTQRPRPNQHPNLNPNTRKPNTVRSRPRPPSQCFERKQPPLWKERLRSSLPRLALLQSRKVPKVPPRRKF